MCGSRIEQRVQVIGRGPAKRERADIIKSVQEFSRISGLCFLFINVHCGPVEKLINQRAERSGKNTEGRSIADRIVDRGIPFPGNNAQLKVKAGEYPVQQHCLYICIIQNH
ncbi:hypothetical protein D3C80_1621420 [compost metagenome]